MLVGGSLGPTEVQGTTPAPLQPCSHASTNRKHDSPAPETVHCPRHNDLPYYTGSGQGIKPNSGVMNGV